ncbi:MAG: TonB-dependent receptor [Ignavibacteriales bacterium]|nr:TonB-dependent receptor [Ignavibacteriales bacterium]
MKTIPAYYFLSLSIIIFSLSVVFPSSVAEAQTVTGSISGEVRDAITKQPLPGANVMLVGTTRGTTSDDKGYYVIKNIDPGTYLVKAAIIGYESSGNPDVVVIPHRNKMISFNLKVSTVEMDVVTVQSDFFSRPAENVVSMRTLSPEEIRRSPGSAEDIFRVMQSMPGVATAGGKSAQLIVRGGSPDENLTLLDNIEIYNPIHFARTGESMGIISIVNPALLEKVDFLTGGFPAKYGDKMSSVFDMTLQDGNKELYNTDVNLNIAGFGVMVDVPLADNSSMIFSLRRGFFDILTGIMNKPAAPRYYDAVGKITYDLNPNNRISIVGFYYIDQIDKAGSTKESSAMSKYDYMTRDDYGSAFGLNWRSLVSQRAFVLTTASFTGNGWTTRQGTETDRALRGEDILEKEFTIKSELTYQISPALDLKLGGQIKMIDSRNESWIPADTSRNGIITPAMTISYIPDMTSKMAVYMQASYRIVKPVTVSAGVRFDRFALTDENNISPRISLSYRFLESTSLNLAWGKYVQSPASYQISPDPRNLLLKSSAAVHYVVGIEHRLADDTRVTVEAYHKELSNLIVAPDSSNLLLNTGSGYARGIEFSLQKKFTEGFVGSASYSYSISKRRDKSSQALYDFEYDRPHIVNLIGGMEIGKGWQLGAKFQFASGNPYTPVIGVVRKGGVFYLVDGDANSARYPDYHKIDVRVDKQFILGGWALTVYLDLWNVYARENIISYSYKADASGNIVLTPKYDFGITPILGMTAKF